MDDLIIPNVGVDKLINWSLSENSVKAEADQEIRPFGCAFYIEDNRARKEYASIRVPQGNSFNLPGDGDKIDFYLQKNEKGLLNSVLAGCFSYNKDDALKKCFHHVKRMTSLWSLKYRRPVGISSIDVHDKKHNVHWVQPKASPSDIPHLSLPSVAFYNTALTSLIAVFSEGMNSTVLSQRFLSYFKIIEAYPNQGPFKEINNYCKNNQIDIPRKKHVVSKDMLREHLTPLCMIILLD